MGRRSSWSAGMVDAALEIVRKTKSADELRKAMSVVLSGVMGLTLPHIGELIGRSRATVARYHAEFRAWLSGRRNKEGQWGGRRRVFFTFEEEKEFFSRFFEMAWKGGMLLSAKYAQHWRRNSGTKWPKAPYIGCWQDMVGGK